MVPDVTPYEVFRLARSMALKNAAAGFGLAECAEVAAEFIGLSLKGARVSVEGFGHVG